MGEERIEVAAAASEERGEVAAAATRRTRLGLLLIGAVAMALPLCFLLIIVAINFGGLR